MNLKRIFLVAALVLLLVGLTDLGIDVSKKYTRAKAVDDAAVQAHPNDAHVPEKKSGYRFLVIGDNGSGLPSQRAVADAMEKRCSSGFGFDGIFFLGDLIYPHGVDAVDDPLWQSLYEDYYRKSPCLSKLMAYPVLGNHDYLGQPAAWIHRHRQTPSFFFPSRSWAVDFGDVVTVVGVDSEVPWLGGSDGLDKFSDKTAWRFVLGHHPFKTASTGGGRHKNAGIVGNALKRKLCGKIHLYMSGHAHHLEHRPMIECNFEHIISGAGGAGVKMADLDDPTAHFVANRWGFFELTVTTEQLEIRAFDTNGDRLYGFSKPLPADKL